MPVPTCPHLSTEIFRRNRVVGLVHLDMTITMNTTLGFMEIRESVYRQWQKGLSFYFFENLANLFACGAVNTCISNVCFPVQQVPILLGKTRKCSSLEGIILNITDPVFDLTFMTRRVRLGRQNNRAVMFAERL